MCSRLYLCKVTMGTTGRFGKSNGLLRGHINCTFKFPFVFLYSARCSHALPVTNSVFFLSPVLAYENTDNSELFIGFMFVLGFFLTTVFLLCFCFFIFWLKRHFFPSQTLPNVVVHRHHHHRHLNSNVPYGHSNQRANMFR